MRGFVIGNGESRSGFDLNRLVGHGPIYGCNALYRDFNPTVLVAVDEAMIEEIDNIDGLPRPFIFIHRVRTENGKKILVSSCCGETFDDNGYAAGQTAVDLMCRRYEDMKEIFLIGFDLFSKTGKVNNVYKGTTCYKTVDGKATYTKNWTEHLRFIFLSNPDIRFVRVCDDELNNEYKVPSWLDVENVFYMNYDQLTTLLDKTERFT